MYSILNRAFGVVLVDFGDQFIRIHQSLNNWPWLPFVMSKKHIIALGFGILLTGLFVYFSLHPYNPGELPTVHMYAYNCMLVSFTTVP